MTLLDNKQLIENFSSPTRTRVQRDEQSYRDMYDVTFEELTECMNKYKKNVFVNDMKARWWRDKMDWAIKRYHDYAIAGNIKSHYIQKGISLKKSNVTFEHVIPGQQVRELLLAGLITIDQALNSPTCRVSKHFDKLLRDAGLVKHSPNCWIFFSRYIVAAKTAGIAIPEFETYNGHQVDPESWELPDHYRYFNVPI